MALFETTYKSPVETYLSVGTSCQYRYFCTSKASTLRRRGPYSLDLLQKKTVEIYLWRFEQLALEQVSDAKLVFR